MSEPPHDEFWHDGPPCPGSVLGAGGSFTPDLGAIRERLDRRLENYREAGQTWGRLVSRPELEALLAAFDAQAAQLAALEAERDELRRLVEGSSRHQGDLLRAYEQERQRATRLATVEAAARAYVEAGLRWEADQADDLSTADFKQMRAEIYAAVANLDAPSGEPS